MPATADRASVASYAQFPAELDRDWLGRVCHLSGADLAVIRRRTDPVTQLGYATQLVTVRAIGTFQPDPSAVPEPVVAAVARQLGIDDLEVLAGYRDCRCGGVTPPRSGTATGTATSLGRTSSPSPSGCTGRPGPMRWPRRCCSARPTGNFLLGRSCCPGKPCWLGWSPRCANAPPIGFTAAWREQSARSCGPSWTNSWWCLRGSAARSWTCCAGRRSRPPSPGWCARWTGWSGFGPWAPAGWTCRTCRRRG